ncbi:MAG TPA: response regulator transcription factor [Candidatus Limivivens merdigallinarum]|uniref:Stage 0 sporulation protein A homolog n=1 Tax=Candidatus Limivivens merdigallinarum TaxID=2840859 RepID=A0A9D0ZYG3_9FIRM|nr:response regulator transcription factor [Candidatus Limivivens merdigallinarum]
MNRILIVEDDRGIQEVLKNYLEAEGYQVSVAWDGVEGIQKFHQEPFSLVLLDIMLPKIDGYGVLEVIRKESDVPVVMLTALEDECYQLKGMKLLADDYVTKPFSPQVLMYKVAAILRRAGADAASQTLSYRELTLDPVEYRAVLGGKELVLTQKEFDLLKVFLTNLGRVFTRQNLLDQVWGIDYFGDERIVDTHIKNLRKKLNRDYIETVRGVGYRIDKADKR